MIEGISPILYEIAPSYDQATPATTEPGFQAAKHYSVYEVAEYEALHNAQPESRVTMANTESTSVELHGFQTALESLQSLNGSLKSLGLDALRMAGEGQSLSPSDMLHISIKSHEFMFQSQLTATVANKTSDGITQLFRQQS